MAVQASMFGPLPGLAQTLNSACRAELGGDVAAEVQALQRLMVLADAELDLLGVQLRRSGRTWAEIGVVFRMSTQGAQQRFGSL